MTINLAVAVAVAAAMTIIEMLLAITAGTTTYVVLVVEALMAMAMETIEIAVVAATTGTIIPVTAMALPMVVEVVVTVVAVTMREEVVSPLETIPGFQEYHTTSSSNNSQVSISLVLFSDHRHHLLPISWCHSLLCYMPRHLPTMVSLSTNPFNLMNDFTSVYHNVIILLICR
jgi:hypothetical protein